MFKPVNQPKGMGDLAGWVPAMSLSTSCSLAGSTLVYNEIVNKKPPEPHASLARTASKPFSQPKGMGALAGWVRRVFLAVYPKSPRGPVQARRQFFLFGWMVDDG